MAGKQPACLVYDADVFVFPRGGNATCIFGIETARSGQCHTTQWQVDPNSEADFLQNGQNALQITKKNAMTRQMSGVNVPVHA